MSRILYFPATYRDEKCLSLNGTDEYAWRHNPAYHTAASGALSLWVKIPELLTANGAIPIIALNVSDAGNDSTFLLLCRQHSGFGDTDNHFDIMVRKTNGGTLWIGAYPSAVAANTWYHIYLDSSGSFRVNDTAGSLIMWAAGGNTWAGEWFGAVSGSNHDIAVGALRRAGSILNYGKVIVNNWMVLNAPLTSGQRTELYGAGQHAHPWNLSFGSAIIDRYDFENDLTDAVGGETLTGVSLDASNYITP